MLYLYKIKQHTKKQKSTLIILPTWVPQSPSLDLLLSAAFWPLAVHSGPTDCV